MFTTCVKFPRVTVGLAVKVKVMGLLVPAGIATALSYVSDNPVGKVVVINSVPVSVPPVFVRVTVIFFDVFCVMLPQSSVAGRAVTDAAVITDPFPGITASCPIA